MANIYEATLDGVRVLLPTLTLNETSKPTEAQAGELLDDVARRVESRVGPPGTWPDAYVDGTAGRRDALTVSAQHVVELGTAAMVQDAAHPNRAKSATQDTGYGTVLWDRYKSALDDLVADVERAKDEAPGAGGAVGHSCPTTPMVTIDQGW